MSHDDQTVLAAQRFYTAHQGEHLACDRAHLVGRCSSHLAELLGLSDRAAQRIAMQVCSEMESAGCVAYIDVGSCVPHMVMLVDPSAGAVHLITVGDLVKVVRERPTWVGLDLAAAKPEQATPG